MTKILSLHKDDRPREKLAKKGAAALSDFELLQALIGSGNKQRDVSQIARDALKLLQKQGADVGYADLQQISGLGSAKITELLAAIELSRRYLLDSDRPIITCTEDAVKELANIRDKKQEYFVTLTLDGACRLIAKRTITIGTLNKTLVHPREVFADAITDRAAHVIVAHNHPSGSLTPSKADRDITERLLMTGQVLGIDILEHIIVTKTDFRSVDL